MVNVMSVGTAVLEIQVLNAFFGQNCNFTSSFFKFPSSLQSVLLILSDGLSFTERLT